jgi:queuine tRNA-ribosyltransferase
MRSEPERLTFEIEAEEGGARAGTLELAHGAMRTPAFIPLATRGTVRAMTSAEVAELGYEMVLGNTYHLMLAPGAEYIGARGGLNEFMGWQRPIITDSGGFQVFSLAHGSVADEIKGRRGSTSSGAVIEISEEGVRFRSYLDGSEHSLTPESSMEVQALLGSDIALVFDECTPFHEGRDYTARSTERTHRWLERCLDWHGENGSATQAVYGIVQGGVFEDLRVQSVDAVCAAGVDGVAIGGTLGKDKEEMRDVVAFTAARLPADAPRHLLGIGEPDDLVTGIAAGIDTFDCAVPTRIARHGMALAPRPDARFRYDVRRSAHASADGPLVEGCPCATCTHHGLAYVHYLARHEEMTAVRMLTLHNLAYTRAVVDGARNAILAAAFAAYMDAILAGSAPWDALGR